MSQPIVRRARREDADLLLALIRELAEYEHLAPPDAAACERLLADGFGERPRFEAYFAEVDGAVVAYAIVFETYSSFLALPTLYLEDLYVRPEARRLGAGRAMMRFLAAEAVRRGCGRMEWVVLDWNELGQSLYRRIAATMLDDWRYCRLTGDALQELAASA